MLLRKTKYMKFKTLIIPIALILFVLFSCKKSIEKEERNYVILSGKINNSSKDSVKVFMGRSDIIKTIAVSNGEFIDSFLVDTGFYILAIGSEITQVFLHNGFNLHIDIDEKEFDESIVYTGEGSDINNYLAQKALNDEIMMGIKNPSLMKLSEQEFLQTLQDIEKQEYDFLRQYDSLPPYFVYLDSAAIALNNLGMINTYAPYKKAFFDKDYVVSDRFPNSLTNLNINNEKLVVLSDYINLLDAYFNQQIDVKNTNGDSLNHTTDKVKLINEEISNAKVKDYLLYYTISQSTTSDEFVALYNPVKKILKNSGFINRIDKTYQANLKIVKGNASPLFSLKNTKDEVVNLQDLQGKLIYIDVWATWCKPCLAEIPFLHKLEEDYQNKNIQFVSICTSSEKDKWLAMVAEKELGGVQLYASKDEQAFLDAYLISGIPRFILLDEQLNIISSDAPRPSDEAIRVLIDENL